jgi:hypothetical protein
MRLQIGLCPDNITVISIFMTDEPAQHASAATDPDRDKSASWPDDAVIAVQIGDIAANMSAPVVWRTSAAVTLPLNPGSTHAYWPSLFYNASGVYSAQAGGRQSTVTLQGVYQDSNGAAVAVGGDLCSLSTPSLM